jgi:sorbitol/mannitol transport system substrate-binding protein
MRPATELVIATVNNGHMIEMQKLTPDFEKANPDIKLKWVTLEEGTLRQRVTTDIATKGGQFDVMTIGLYETPIWSKKGWLQAHRQADAAYDIDDLLPAIRNGLSLDGKLYAAPFYGESSMLMYRKDLADKAGIKLPEQPTWAQVKDWPAKIHDPKAGVYGMCLRGKPGWGDNMAFLTTMVNTFGGQWFDMAVEAADRHQALEGRDRLLRRPDEEVRPARRLGQQLQREPGALQRRQVRHVGGRDHRRFVHQRPEAKKVADKVAFAQAPVRRHAEGRELAVGVEPGHSGQLEEGSGAEVHQMGHLQGLHQPGRQGNRLGAVPTGTRKSTYANPEFQKVAKFAAAEKKAIDSANPNDSTLPKSPYVGVQYAAIPEFQAIGIAVGQQMSAALAGKVTVDQALKTSQTPPTAR